MQLQLFENKGDLMIVIKDAPKGTKDQLEKMFAEYAITELKGLVKTEEPIPDTNDGWEKVSDDGDNGVPFVFGALTYGETKSDFKNENIPFNKPEPKKEETEKSASKEYDPFE